MEDKVVEIARIAANTIIWVAIISAAAATMQVLIENWFGTRKEKRGKDTQQSYDS